MLGKLFLMLLVLVSMQLQAHASRAHRGTNTQLHKFTVKTPDIVCSAQGSGELADKGRK